MLTRWFRMRSVMPKTTMWLEGWDFELWEIASPISRQGKAVRDWVQPFWTNDTISHGYTMGTLIKTADTKAQVSVLWLAIRYHHTSMRRVMSWSSCGGDKNVTSFSCLEPSQTSPNANFLFNWSWLISLR